MEKFRCAQYIGKRSKYDLLMGIDLHITRTLIYEFHY